MRIRAIWAMALGLMAGVACSAPDPGVAVLGPQQNNSPNPSTSTPGGSSSDAGNVTAPPPVTVDAGHSGSDAGSAGSEGGGSTGPLTAFSNAPAYASSPP